MTKSKFRQALEAAVLERHCANHPMTEKWAKGELGRAAMMGWGVEHYHWVNNYHIVNFTIAAKAPRDVIEMQLENFREEADDDKPHIEIVLKFAAANGADINKVRQGRGLPSTRAWRNWLFETARDNHWVAGVASTTIGTESQSPMLYSKVLPALREIYKFDEDAIEHFSLHVDADTEHGDAGFDVLEKHCTTSELKDMAIHYARESAQMRWFYFDGIHLHYETGYPLTADTDRH